MEIAKKTNLNKSLLQIKAKLYYKLGHFVWPTGASVVTNWVNFVLIQIGASVITYWGSLIITNRGKFYYKSGQLLQIRATIVTN